MCVLNLTMPFESTDVNVHPNKWEVRFQDEAGVRDAVETLVRESLTETQKEALFAPKLFDDPLHAEIKKTKPQIEAAEVVKAPTPEHDQEKPVIVPPKAAPVQMPPAPQAADRRIPTSFHAPKPQMKDEEPAITPPPVPKQQPAEPEQQTIDRPKAERELYVLGAAFQTYIIMEYGEDLILCDQHAAHERLLYERLMRETKQGPASQTMLIPKAIPVNRTQYAVFRDNEETLRTIGFDVTALGEDTLRLSGVPVILGVPEAEDCLLDVLDELSQYGKLDPYDKVLRIAQTACKHAVKGGEKVRNEELIWLVKQIMNNDLPPTCPHGRPLMITLSKTDLDKRFRRIQQRT